MLSGLAWMVNRWAGIRKDVYSRTEDLHEDIVSAVNEVYEEEVKKRY